MHSLMCPWFWFFSDVGGVEVVKIHVQNIVLQANGEMLCMSEVSILAQII